MTWDATGQPLLLSGSMPSGDKSYAWALNSHGWVVGEQHGSLGIVSGILWIEGMHCELGLLPLPRPVVEVSSA